MRDLDANEVKALIERGRRSHSKLGVAGAFGTARLGKNISSSQNDMLAVLMIIGEGIAFADPEAHNGVDGYAGLAVALQSAADFYRHFSEMHKADGLAPYQTAYNTLPAHLYDIVALDGARAQRLSELTRPIGLILGQTLNLNHRVRKLEKSDEPASQSETSV